MRIVGGALRGRKLTGPKSLSIRPTSDRLRETIFDILAHAYPGSIEDASVIDLFAGAGALGLEALSRGAARALFVDQGAEARALLRQNIEALGLGGVTRVFRRDATRLGLAPKAERFGLAFLDPPYGQNLAPQPWRSSRGASGSRRTRSPSSRRPPALRSSFPKVFVRKRPVATATRRSFSRAGKAQADQIRTIADDDIRHFGYAASEI